MTTDNKITNAVKIISLTNNNTTVQNSSNNNNNSTNNSGSSIQEKTTTTTTTKTRSKVVVPKMGPDPTLLSRKEIDALYETFEAIIDALEILRVDYIITGGSLLGAVRQHSILFCDDDIDIAILDYTHCCKTAKTTAAAMNHEKESNYDRVKQNLARLLNNKNTNNKKYNYFVRPWEGGDKVRPIKMNTVFVDVFTLRKYNTMDELLSVIGIKKNGQPQSKEYIHRILQIITKALFVTATTSVTNNHDDKHNNHNDEPLFPFWHFNTRKAIEMWPKEVYREHELFPLQRNYKFGPLDQITGPRMPVTLLQRAFGNECFRVYYKSVSHNTTTNTNTTADSNKYNDPDNNNTILPPLILGGGTWEGNPKAVLEEEHYIPIQPTERKKRRPTYHNKQQLFQYLQEQTQLEQTWSSSTVTNNEATITATTNDNKIKNNNNEAHSSSRSSICTANNSDTMNNSNNSNSTLVNHNNTTTTTTIYMDGIFDLFHIGHLKAIQYCKQLLYHNDNATTTTTRKDHNMVVIIGITGDIDATGYKRPPIFNEQDRTEIIKAVRYVDQILCPCPLDITQPFMEQYNIDWVVHGFSSPNDASYQMKQFFSYPNSIGKFQQIPYTHCISTTDIITKIMQLEQQERQEQEQESPNSIRKIVVENENEDDNNNNNNKINNNKIDGYNNNTIKEETKKTDIMINNHSITNSIVVYLTGVFDLFHIGHLRAIEYCKTSKLLFHNDHTNVHLVVGIVGDDDTDTATIISQGHRREIVESIQHVDHVLCPCPRYITKEFMSHYSIDIVVEGIEEDDEDTISCTKKKNDWYSYPRSIGKFQTVPYYSDKNNSSSRISTKNIIQKIQSLSKEEETKLVL